MNLKKNFFGIVLLFLIIVFMGLFYFKNETRCQQLGISLQKDVEFRNYVMRFVNNKITDYQFWSKASEGAGARSGQLSNHPFIWENLNFAEGYFDDDNKSLYSVELIGKKNRLTYHDFDANEVGQMRIIYKRSEIIIRLSEDGQYNNMRYRIVQKHKNYKNINEQLSFICW